MLFARGDQTYHVVGHRGVLSTVVVIAYVGQIMIYLSYEGHLDARLAV